MNVIVLDPPTEEPIELDEDFYAAMRIAPIGSPPSHPHDNLFRRHITTARIEAEQITGRAFVRQRLLLVTDVVPRDRYIPLLRPPVQEVLSVGYYDTNGALQTLATGDYVVTDDIAPRVSFDVSSSIYGAYGQVSDAIRIEYWAGYPGEGSPPDYVAGVPTPIKDGIIIGVQLLYNELTPQERQSLESARECLLSGYKVRMIF